jgi:hypothetical protein
MPNIIYLEYAIAIVVVGSVVVTVIQLDTVPLG